MQPETGGRYSLRLRDHDERHARFELELATPAGTWLAGAEVSASEGLIQLSSWAGNGEPPPWLCHYTRAALRAAWRQHREQGWPRRVTRWRDVPAHGRMSEGALDE